jgi:hypothetical protein
MSQGKYEYFKDQFTNLETELNITLDETHDFFLDYDDINPADSTLKIRSIMNKIAELKLTEDDLRTEIKNQQFDSAEEANNTNDNNININENERYKDVLKDKIYMYNHHTSYGIILFIGICSMAYLSQPVKIGN